MHTAERPFYGRDRLLRELTRGLRAGAPRSYSLIGPKLIGKTRLLQLLASDAGPLSSSNPTGERVRAVYVDCATAEAQLGLAALVAGQIEADTVRTVALLDDIDVFPRQSPDPAQTVAELSSLMHQIPVVAASEQPLHDVYAGGDAAGAFDGMTQLFLGLMERAAGHQFLESYGEEWPALRPVADDLLAWTGFHPYLLDRLAYALDDAQGRLAPGQELGPEHLPLIRMRLAEHARPLFLALWQESQSPPPRVNVRTLMALMEQLLRAPVPIDPASEDQAAELNWLISQAVVVYDSRGYRMATPLFADFLSGRIGAVASGHLRRVAANGDDSPFINSLTKTENALLRYFQANTNAIVSPEELLAAVWKQPDASPRRVQEAIRRLRLRLDEATPPVGVIQNERGRGYRFVPTHP